jgi:hypothetical protein
MAQNFLSLVFLFILVLVGITVGIGSITELYDANTHGCVFDVNGTLTNCSQSDYAYNKFTAVTNTAGQQFSLVGNVNYVLMIAVVGGSFLLLAGVMSRRK